MSDFAGITFDWEYANPAIKWPDGSLRLSGSIIVYSQEALDGLFGYLREEASARPIATVLDTDTVVAPVFDYWGPDATAQIDTPVLTPPEEGGWYSALLVSFERKEKKALDGWGIDPAANIHFCDAEWIITKYNTPPPPPPDDTMSPWTYAGEWDSAQAGSYARYTIVHKHVGSNRFYWLNTPGDTTAPGGWFNWLPLEAADSADAATYTPNTVWYTDGGDPDDPTNDGIYAMTYDGAPTGDPPDNGWQEIKAPGGGAVGPPTDYFYAGTYDLTQAYSDYAVVWDAFDAMFAYLPPGSGTFAPTSNPNDGPASGTSAFSPPWVAMTTNPYRWSHTASYLAPSLVYYRNGIYEAQVNVTGGADPPNDPDTWRELKPCDPPTMYTYYGEWNAGTSYPPASLVWHTPSGNFYYWNRLNSSAAVTGTAPNGYWSTVALIQGAYPSNWVVNDQALIAVSAGNVDLAGVYEGVSFPKSIAGHAPADYLGTEFVELHPPGGAP